MGPWVNVFFLGSAQTFMLVYIWGRRNPQVRMNILGLFTFSCVVGGFFLRAACPPTVARGGCSPRGPGRSAEWLPWVLIGLSMLLNNNTVADLMGIAVGHVYYFLDDVYPKPRALGGLGGHRVLATPAWLARVFDGRPADPNYADDEPAGVAPGGFAWGQGQALGHNQAQ